LDTALQLDSSNVPALVARADVLLALHRTAEALAHYERALVLRPNDPDALVNSAAALIELLRPQEALISSDLAQRVDPRVAFAVVDVFSRINGHSITTDSKALYDHIMRLFEKRTFDIEHLVPWLQEIVRPPVPMS
jgi:tetratricopeptide (TPR) repeat protein